MSSISSLSGGGQSIFQYLKSLQSGTQTKKTSAANASTALPSAGKNLPSEPKQAIEDALSKVLKNHQNSRSKRTDALGIDAATGGTKPANQSSPFSQLLNSKGMNVEQFQKEFLKAIQSAQNASAGNASNALSAISSGSLVDTVG